MEFVIRKEFKDLITPLSEDELSGLEKAILSDGKCRDPLVIWFDEEEGEYVLLDGHHRWGIIQRLGIKEYKTDITKLPKGTEPEEWIVENQFSRRNLDTYNRANLFLKLKPILAAKAQFRKETGYFSSEKESAVTEVMNSSPPENTGLEPENQDFSTTPDKVGKTRKIIAQKAGVSEDSIRKTEIINKSGNDEIIAKVRTGEISLNKAFKEIRKPEEPEVNLSKPAHERWNPNTFRPKIQGQNKEKTWHEKFRQYLCGKIDAAKKQNTSGRLDRDDQLQAEASLYTLRDVRRKFNELKPR